jgi:hypothetical protein
MSPPGRLQVLCLSNSSLHCRLSSCTFNGCSRAGRSKSRMPAPSRGCVKTRTPSACAPSRPSRSAQDRRSSLREGFDDPENRAVTEFSHGLSLLRVFAQRSWKAMCRQTPPMNSTITWFNTQLPTPVSPSNRPLRHTYNPLNSNAFCVCQIDTVLHFYFENTEHNRIEPASKRPELPPAARPVALAELAIAPRHAGQRQKRQCQPRLVGFERCCPGADPGSNPVLQRVSSAAGDCPGQPFRRTAVRSCRPAGAPDQRRS